MSSKLILYDDLIKNISEDIENIDGVIISDYAKGICSEVLLKKVIKISNNNNIPIFVDPKGLIGRKYNIQI